MGIYQRQYQKILSQEFLRYFLLGISPNATEAAERIKKKLGEDGKTTFQFIPQPNNEVFNVDLYNKALKEIKFDIDTFQEELFDLFKDSYKRINYADLYNKIQSYNLTQLQKELETLLFTTENADFYFLGAYDTFSDVSKTNTDVSTEGVVNLSEQALVLPYGSRGSKKIDTREIRLKEYWPVEVLQPTGPFLVLNQQVQGTSFSNMFIDTISFWAYEIRSSEEGRAQIKVKFPIGGLSLEEKEIFINRIELIPHSVNKQNILIKVSSDNVNFSPINGYEEGIEVDDPSKVYGIDFETNLVQYVEITFTKENSDDQLGESNVKQFQYLFGLKSIGFFQTGRFTKAIYQSKPFTIGESESISRVSIQSNAIVPNNSTINYSVALQNNAGEIGNFLPIKPLGEIAQIGIPEVINFGTDIRNNKVFSIPGNNPPLYGTPFQGKYFYRLGEEITPRPIFGSARLYRGFKGWERDKSRGFEIKEISDVFISFAQSDIESMYDIKTEVPQYTNINEFGNEERQVQLTLTRPPYYISNRGHALVPQNSNISNNISPNYAIYAIRQVSSRNRVNGFFQLESTRSRLPTTNFVLYSSNPEDRPEIPGYRQGIDYNFETETFGDSEKPTGYILIPTGSKFLDASGNVRRNTAFTFNYTPDPDITHKVQRIEGNIVTLSNANVDYYSNLEIEYRFIPTAPSEIIKPSIRVSNGPASSATVDFYVEGRDYAVDPLTGNIQRIPTGNIPDDGSVYIQFSYRDSEDAIETFQTWCYVSSESGTQIRFDLAPDQQRNALTIDEEIGEAFYINTPQGLIDLSNASSTPVLNSGWVQFIVRSKDPDANILFRSNLIDQVIQLRDLDKRKIFKEQNNYFREITAFRNPLRQKTLNHLKVNTLALDNSVFAIDDQTEPTKAYIVTNFRPGGTENFYNREPTEEQIEDDRPPLFDEVFRFIWSSKSTSENLGNKLIVRIELESNSEFSSSGSTPKVFDYSVRASV